MSRAPLPRSHVLIGDAHDQMARLPECSVDMVMTSPPYFNLRNYQVAGQLGLEPSVEQWVDNLRAVAQQAHRLLVPTGSFWLNVSDSYSTHASQGAGKKSLLLGPERLALALLQDGWLLRNKIVWQKANPMPSSVTDRLNTGWEALYVFVKQPRYFFDLDAIRVPHTSRPSKRQRVTAAVRGRETWRGPNSAAATGIDAMKADGRVAHPLGKNPADVWRIASSNYRGGHHATFPIALASKAISAGAPEARCVLCRKPWQRDILRHLGGIATRSALHAICDCDAASEPGLVLDPFMGAGTTAVAAEQLGREWLGIELNPEFACLAEARIRQARASPLTNAT